MGRPSDDELLHLANEQAALRHVATLVAQRASPTEVFAAVAEESARVLDVALTSVVRYERGKTAIQVGAWGHENPFAVGTRWKLDDLSVSGQVLRTGRAARVDDYTDVGGSIADALRDVGIRSAVGAPIIVDGHVWGVLMALSAATRPLPGEAASRLNAFTELIGTSISNTDAREHLRTVAEEQAALRRVATLVAREASPTEVFDAVATEVGHVLEIPMTSILCYDVGESAIKVGGSGVENPYPVGARFPPQAGVIMEVGRTGRPARVDDYGAIPNEVARRLAAAGIRSSVGVPIIVNGRTWGVMVALSTASEQLPPDTEERLADFTELVATAIANTEARTELRQLADEQSALRRVATLVAGGTGARGVFDAVCEETGRLVGATSVNLARFTSDGFNLTMAGWSLHDTHVPTGTRLALEGETINNVIRRTRAPARVDSYVGVTGELAALIRERGIRSEIGAPVIVEGEVWGALIAGWDVDDLAPPETESRLANFAELTATAVSNASNRAELVTSRARIVASADEARRRIERDLHDGTQQQLVALGLDVKSLQGSLPPGLDHTNADLERLRDGLDAVLENVREISQGVHPATLSQWGLEPAVRTLARRCAVPIELDVDVPGRLPQSVEIAAHYVISEALANVAKHAEASYVRVGLHVTHGRLETTIEDDGTGGADADRGSGLTGLVDRVDALGGHLSLSSPPGKGTSVSVTLPLEPSERT